MEYFFIFLSEPLARFVLLPLLIVALGTFVKYTCQNDRHASFNRELFYWGPDLCVSGLLALIVDVSNNIGKLGDNKIYGYFSTILILLLISGTLLFVVSLIVRKRGWKESESGWRYSWWGGIIIPNFIGLGLLIIIYMVAG